VVEDAPLFALVTNHHRRHPQLREDFGTTAVRQTALRIASDPNRPGRYLREWNMRVRGRVSELTSGQAFQGDFRKAVRQLTEDCHECGAILVDAMTALWTRIQEGRGMQWKKALLALQILRELLLNGPINIVAEAIDGFASIRVLKNYYVEAIRAQNSKLVRAAAAEVYALTVDFPVLFARRRERMERRRVAQNPNAKQPSQLVRKETRMLKGISRFRDIHVALRPPGVVAAVAPAPRSAPVANLLVGATPNNAASAHASGGPPSGGNDLLSLGAFVATPSPLAGPSSVAIGNEVIGGRGYSADFLGLSFGIDPSMSSKPQAPGGSAAANSTSGGDKQQTASTPFGMNAMSQAMPNIAGPQPVVAGKGPASQPMPTQQPSPIASQPMQNNSQPQQLPSQPAMNQYQMMTMQPKQAQHQQRQPQPAMNTAFANPNGTQVPPSLSMHPQQIQQSQTTMKVPVMNLSPMAVPPAHGGSFSANYHQPPPPQQPWTGNTAAGFSQNGYQAGLNNHQPMHPPPPQNAAYGAGYPVMQQSAGAAAPQFQQGAPGGMNPYSPMATSQQKTNVQKK